jgi:hypothetical protein
MLRNYQTGIRSTKILLSLWSVMIQFQVRILAVILDVLAEVSVVFLSPSKQVLGQYLNVSHCRSICYIFIVLVLILRYITDPVRATLLSSNEHK